MGQTVDILGFKNDGKGVRVILIRVEGST